MSLDQLYQQIILDHSKQRHGSGLAETDAPDGYVHRSIAPTEPRVRR